MRETPLTVLSAFSGLGGLDLGLECAGFQNLGCIEQDSFARASLTFNRPNWRLLEPHEICSVAANILPRDLGLRRKGLALLAGAPPCQPFSKAAQWCSSGRRGLTDPRSASLGGFFGLIRRFLPKAVLIENVPGFVSGDKSALPRIEYELRSINRTEGTQYRVSCFLVDAADFGVPQHRKRAILVAHREGRAFVMPYPTHRNCPTTAWDALYPISRVRNSKLNAISGLWRDLLPSIPEGQNYIWHTPRGGGSPLFGYRTRYWSFLLKLARDKPAWTLAAQPGPNTGPFHWENRRLTDAESLRLQSIPENWVVAGNEQQRTLQIGNATPSLLAEVLGRAIASQFFQRSYRSTLKLEIPKAARIASAKLPAPLPRKFKRLIKVLPDHPGAGKGPRPLLVA